MRLAPAALGGFTLAIALILIFIYIAPQTNQPLVYSGAQTPTVTSTATTTTTATTTATLTTTTTTTATASSQVTKTTTSSASSSTTSTTTSKTTATTTSLTTSSIVSTTTASTTVTSTQPAQTTTLTSSVTASTELPTEITYTIIGVAAIATIIATILVVRRNTVSATALATAEIAAEAETQPYSAVNISFDVDSEYMGEVKEEAKTVGYWISIPRGTSRNIKVTLTPTDTQPQTTTLKVLSTPKGVVGTFNPPNITLEEPKSETVTLTLEINNDAQPGIYILSITADSSKEKLHLLIE
jgi:hypothetical protein